MASVVPGPDPFALTWLSMLALEHGRSGTGAWLTGAAVSGSGVRRRRRRARAPVAADPLPAAPVDAAVEADGEPEAGEQTAGTTSEAPEHSRQQHHEPPVPRLQALEWRPATAGTSRAAEVARQAVQAAERLARARPRETAAIGGSVLVLLLLRLTRRRKGHSSDARVEAPASGGAQQPATLQGGVPGRAASGDDAPGADVGDGMLAPVLKGSALSVRENGQWLERVLMLRADHTLHTRSLSPGAGAPASIPLHGAVASPVPGEPLCFTLDTADDCCLLLRCRTRHESDSWVQVLNAASLALGAPMLSSLARPHGSLGGGETHLVAAPAFGYGSDGGDSSIEGSSLEDGDDADGLLASHLRYSPRHRSASGDPRARAPPPPPIVRGVLVLARSVLTAVVAPVRISAALVILPFALVVHGTASAVRSVVFGPSRDSSRQPAWRGQGAEDAEAAPEKQALLQRFLTEDLDMSAHGHD